MTRSLFALLIAVTIQALPEASLAAGELPIVRLSINGHRIDAEVASTPEQRATGLMHRFSLRPDHGMLFVFERAEPLGFWMKNTFIPLSIAFVAADGRIINIEDMAPHDESTHRSGAPARYAIEMRKNWFAERGIKSGDRVDGLPASTR